MNEGNCTRCGGEDSWSADVVRRYDGIWYHANIDQCVQHLAQEIAELKKTTDARTGDRDV